MSANIRPGLARVAAASALALALLVGGYSEAEAISAKVRRACVGDYKRLCPGYKVGSTALRACMESKYREISSRCMDALIDSGEVDRSRGRR